MLIWDCAIISFIAWFPLPFYFILRNHLVSNWREALFKFSVDKQHWKHSIYDKSLFILMFLSYY